MIKKLCFAVAVLAGMTFLGGSADAYPWRWRRADVYYAQPVAGPYYGGYYNRPVGYYGRPYYRPRMYVAPYGYNAPVYYRTWNQPMYVY